MDRQVDQDERLSAPVRVDSTWAFADESLRPVRLGSAGGDEPAPHGGDQAARRPPWSRDHLHRLLGEHGLRFVSFGAVGGFVFLLGLGLQVFLVQVWGFGSDVSYVVQGIVSVQVSFLLNYYWTWRDKEIPFWPAWYKFNAQKVVTTVFNLLIYAALIALHVNYLVANIATTAVFTAVNYLVGNFWAFVPAKGK